jgi:hypothetical protein
MSLYEVQREWRGKWIGCPGVNSRSKKTAERMLERMRLRYPGQKLRVVPILMGPSRGKIAL